MKVGPEVDQSEIFIRNWAPWTRVTKGIYNGCMGLSVSGALLAVINACMLLSAYYTCISGEPFTSREGSLWADRGLCSGCNYVKESK